MVLIPTERVPWEETVPQVEFPGPGPENRKSRGKGNYSIANEQIERNKSEIILFELLMILFPEGKLPRETPGTASFALHNYTLAAGGAPVSATEAAGKFAGKPARGRVS